MKIVGVVFMFDNPVTIRIYEPENIAEAIGAKLAGSGVTLVLSDQEALSEIALNSFRRENGKNYGIFSWNRFLKMGLDGMIYAGESRYFSSFLDQLHGAGSRVKTLGILEVFNFPEVAETNSSYEKIFRSKDSRELASGICNLL